jgi:hypothetical protein
MTTAPISNTINPYNENTLNLGLRDLGSIRGIAKIKARFHGLIPVEYVHTLRMIARNKDTLYLQFREMSCTLEGA